MEGVPGDKPVASTDLSIGTNSVDVTLGSKFVTIHQAQLRDYIDPYDPASMTTTGWSTPTIVFEPHGTILGHIRERFDLGDNRWEHGGQIYSVHPMYDGRSTCGRLFIASHITAGFGDVGFKPAWTLELKNMNEVNRVALHAGMRIGQVSFHLIVGEPEDVYNGAYTDQHDGPKVPVLGKERF